MEARAVSALGDLLLGNATPSFQLAAAVDRRGSLAYAHSPRYGRGEGSCQGSTLDVYAPADLKRATGIEHGKGTF